jgi:hypothetical protein
MIQSFIPSKTLDMDSSPAYVPNGAYVDALDVRPVSNKGGDSVSYENILGNELKITLPSISAQDKKYKLSYPSVGTWSSVLNLYNINGTFLGATIVNQTNTVSTIETFINGAIGTNQTYSGSNPLTVDFISYKNYSLTVTADGGNAVLLTIIELQESLDPAIDGQTGQLLPIGSNELEGDLFIFSTCCANNTGGTGQIGVAVWDANSLTYTYTALLTSKELLWSTQYPFDKNRITSRIFNEQRAFYFVNGFNFDRVFYYKGTYQTNGAINYVDSNNIYNYGSINSQLRLDASDNTVTIAYSNQYQSGGSLKSGTWYYSARQLTSALSATDYCPLSNQFITYLVSDTSDPSTIQGNAADTTTSKVNEMIISGLDPTTYSYLELVTVHLTAGSVVGYFIKRINITGTTMTVQHTGNESTISVLDLSTLLINDLSFIPKFSSCITQNKNHLLRANLTVEDRTIYAAVAASATLTTITKQLTNTGYVDSSGNAHYVFGGYQDPNNVYNYTGYMANEKYLIRIMFLTKSGLFTEAFDAGVWTVTPTISDLTETGATGNLNNYGLHISVDITSIKDDILAIIPLRAELIPEILFTGILSSMYYDNANTSDYYTGFFGGGTTLDRKVWAAFAPDFAFNYTSYNFQSGDILRVYGQGELTASPSGTGAVGNYTSQLNEYNGYFHNHTYTDYTLIDGQFVLLDQTITLNVSGPATINFHNYWLTSGTDYVYSTPCIAFSTTSNVTNTTTNTDHQTYYFQLYRPKPNKYTNAENLPSYSTNTFFLTNNVSSVAAIDVYGGDTYTTKCYYKLDSGEYAFHNPRDTKQGDGNGIYAQCKVNVNMRNSSGSSNTGYWFPANAGSGSWATKIGTWNTDIPAEQVSYDLGYSDNRSGQSYAAYNPNLTYPTQFPTRIIYSPESPEGSATDFYRTLLPLDFRDESMVEGQIIGLMSLNGNVYTLSENAFRLQYFGTPSQVQMTGSENLAIQSGSGFSQASTRISTYGCKHFFGWVIGRSSSGDQVLYWINTTYKKFCRFAQDGERVLSDIDGMKTFFANNLNFADLYDNPFYNYGISAAWDDRFNEAIFTVRAQYLPLNGSGGLVEWFSNGIYTVGQVVTDGNTTTGFEGLLNLWVCIQNTGTGSHDAQPLSNTSYWTALTDFKNNNYWNVYTVAWNEIKSGFTTFYTFKPYFYLQHRNTILSPISNRSTGTIYLHNSGNIYNTFYGSQTSEPYITGIINQDSTIERIYQFIVMYCDYQPLVYLYTNETETYIEPSEFEIDGDRITLNIFNDILTSSDGNTRTENTRKISGTWIKIKTILITPSSTTSYNKLNYLLIGSRNRLPQYSYSK